MADVTDPIDVPARGTITDLGIGSGTITTESGREIRFGLTACSGFVPEVGMDVWLMAYKTMSIGHRATLVNLTGASEATDPVVRAKARQEANDLALRNAMDTRRAAARTLLAKTEGDGLPEGWHPGLGALAQVVSLPPALERLRALVPMGDESEADDGGAVRPVDLAEAQRVADAMPDASQARFVLSSAQPWPVHDPCLVPFGQIDGEQPDLVAVYFHPELFSHDGALPIVYWRHDDALDFLADDAETFLSALVSGRFQLDGASVLPAPGFDTSGIPTAAGPFVDNAVLPDRYAAFMSRPKPLWEQIDALVDASLGDDLQPVFDGCRAVAAECDALGWRLHAMSCRYQLRAFLAQQ